MKQQTEQRTPKPLRTILLATALVSSFPIHAESDLLKQAIYAEETEGDLQKAIELYQQEVQAHADKSDFSQEWASALLHSAKCQLKLGKKEEARVAAHQIIEKLERETPESQAARAFLAPLEPKKTRKVTIPDVDQRTQGTLLDFETGQLISSAHIPIEEQEEVNFLEKQGVDLVVEFVGEQKGLGIIGRLAQVEQHYWNELPDYAEIDKLLAKLAPQQPPIEKKGNCEFHFIHEDIDLPATYLFRSSSHATGVLQVLSIDEEKQEITIVYQLVPRILEGEALKKHVIGRWTTPGKEDGMNFDADGTWFEDEGSPDHTDDHGSYRVQGSHILLTVPNRPETRVTVRLEEAQTIFELQSGERKKEITGIRTPFPLTPKQKIQKAKIQVPAMLALVQTISKGVQKKDQHSTRRSVDTFLRELRTLSPLFKNTELEGMADPLIPQVEQLREAVTQQNWEEAQQVWEGIMTVGPMMEKMLEEQLSK